MIADAVLDSSPGIETCLEGAKGRDHLIGSNYCRKAEAKEWIADDAGEARGTTDDQAAVIETGARQNVRLHRTCGARRMTGVNVSDHTSACPFGCPKLARVELVSPHLLVRKVQVGKKVWGHRQSASEIQIPSGVETGASVRSGHGKPGSGAE